MVAVWRHRPPSQRSSRSPARRQAAAPRRKSELKIGLAHRHCARYDAFVAPDARDLGLSVDRGAEVPLGTQLAWRLRQLVDGGSLRPGDRLPSVRELAIEAGVNVNTARSVYGRLENEGLVSSEQGRGTFVTGAEKTTR